MTLAYGDRVRETTNTTGTGNLSLNGAFNSRWRTFAQEIGTHEFMQYVIDADGGSDWEIGWCRIIPGSPDQLERYLVTKNSDGTQVPINLPAGTHVVQCSVASDFYYLVDEITARTLIGGEFTYDAVNGFKILPGTMGIDGLTKVWTATLTGPGSGGYAVSATNYVYLYTTVPGDLVPAIEVSTDIPILSPAYRYWNRNGDDSRRLIGFFRANAAGAVHEFVGLRNGSELTVFYEQNADTEVFNGQSEAGWTKITAADQFIPQGAFTAAFSVEMSFTNQNNANKIGFHPLDISTDPVEAGIYRQAFSANRDTTIIEDSNIQIPLVKENPALYTRNENYNGSTAYIVNFDGVQLNLLP